MCRHSVEFMKDTRAYPEHMSVFDMLFPHEEEEMSFLSNRPL